MIFLEFYFKKRFKILFLKQNFGKKKVFRETIFCFLKQKLDTENL